MTIRHYFRCLVGRHHRDGRNARAQGDQVHSRCVHCGIAMVKEQGTWRARGSTRIRVYAILVLAIVLTMVLFWQLGGLGRQRQDLVVFVGDSITEGVASSDPLTASRPGLYQAHIGNRVIVANEGVNGITLGSLAGRVSSIENYYRRGRRNVVVIEAGSNDFAQGAKAIPLFAILRDYAKRLQDGGWTVGVATVMPRNGLPADQERERRTFNRLIVGGPLPSQGIGVLDFDAAYRAGRIEIADGVHPSDAGYAAMSKLDIAFADHALGRR